MFDEFNEAFVSEVKCDDSKAGVGKVNSFKNIRKIRKKFRLKRKLEKSLDIKKKSLRGTLFEKPSVGPTIETATKLKQDPLVRFKNHNILNDEQIWAFQRIRRAVQIITDGTQVRTSRFNAVVVQTSRLGEQNESDFEIRIKDHYSSWIDRMTTERLQAGPVLDIIIDEMSLNAVDRKWGKRKGWAKTHLQTSLDLFMAFSPSSNRN